MLPLSDGLKTRSFPIVNASLIVVNFAVWLFYELPHLLGVIGFFAVFSLALVRGGRCRQIPPVTARAGA
jgi:hypothetical protein